MRLLALALGVFMLCCSTADAGCFLFDFKCRDDAYCKSLGAKPGTDVYVQCRLTVSGQRRQGVAKAIDDWQLQRQLNRPRTCTTTRFGDTFQTNCF